MAVINRKTRPLVIVGSSRNDGGTLEMLAQLNQLAGWDVIDLNDLSFSYFDYDHLNREDDFLPMMRRVVPRYDTFIFATPVYWYSMSGILKVFFDRITDLLTIEKELGRQLQGKRMAVITSSIGNHMGDHFWLPFAETARYLGMDFLTGVHTLSGKDNSALIRQFVRKVEGIQDQSKTT